MYMYVYIFMSVLLYMCSYICMSECVYMCVHACMSMCSYTVHVYVWACFCKCFLYMCMSKCVCVCEHASIFLYLQVSSLIDAAGLMSISSETVVMSSPACHLSPTVARGGGGVSGGRG